MGVFFITSSGYILLAVTPTSGIVNVIPEHADSFEEIHNQLNEALTQVEGL